MSAAVERTHSALIKAVEDHYRAILPEISAQMENQFQRAADWDDEFVRMQAAFNVLLPCVEAGLNAMTPYSATIPVELAQRIASALISSLPVEFQDEAVAHMVSTLPDLHRHRISKGLKISTSWDMEGEGERPNFPTAS
jgi:hypothetical protein